MTEKAKERVMEILERLFNDGIKFDSCPYGRKHFLIPAYKEIVEAVENEMD